MPSVVADTHALVWFLLEPRKLSAAGLTAMKQADAVATIYIPSVVLVELRYLVEKATITEQVFQFIADAIADPNTSLEVAPLDFEVAKAVGQIAKASIPDMPDRIIAATAL
jgi:PIN domain nuclease of toxin-antitoxin system